MGLFSLEHGRAAYQADFALYGGAVVLLAAFLCVAAPLEMRVQAALYTLLGLGSWSAIEYAFHRFILHGMQPFSRWHAQHHQRPKARICTPTVLSAALIVMLVSLPAYLLWGVWRAAGFTLGVLAGYFAYSVVHHAMHHWHTDSAWLRQRKRWHALHHVHSGVPACYGVTSAFWDHVFGTACPGGKGLRP